MKSLLTLLDSLIAESGEICSADATMDIKTVHRRFENQGLSFLTIDLPSFETDLLIGLDRGEITPDLFSNFKKRQKLPVLFGGFLELIFDRASGSILEDPSIDAIRCLRQICLLYKKIELPCSDILIQKAFDRYFECDIEVENWEKSHDEDLLLRFRRLSSLVFSHVFRRVNDDIRDLGIVPKHGPGATAEKVLANAKYEFRTWSERCEAVFPYWWYATIHGYSSERYSSVTFEEPGAETPVRVIAVPKTQKTPRIIAEEPSYMQYLQQGIARSIKREVDRSFLYDFISTEYQLPNQQLAQRGSLDGTLATLDLSEASDRISYLLVKDMCSGFPHLLDGIDATRSSRADVPGIGVIPLSRYASMGSGLCFPIETMVFFIAVLIGIERSNGSNFTSISQIMGLKGQVRVYGDDIIVPTDNADSVALTLELFGFKVNTHKSFWNGKFRESCGAEYYAGVDVTVARFKHEYPRSRKDVSEMISLVKFRNNLYYRGYWNTVRMLDESITSFIPFPAVEETSEVLGRSTFLPVSGDRIGGRFQRPLVRGAVVKYHKRISQIADDAALMKTLGFSSSVNGSLFLEGEHDPETVSLHFLQQGIVETEADHLMTGGRPIASRIHDGWHYAN